MIGILADFDPFAGAPTSKLGRVPILQSLQRTRKQGRVAHAKSNDVYWYSSRLNTSQPFRLTKIPGTATKSRPQTGGLSASILNFGSVVRSTKVSLIYFAASSKKLWHTPRSIGPSLAPFNSTSLFPSSGKSGELGA